MYSFAFILWELWYGERVFADTVVSRHQSKLLQDVKDGFRPCHIDKTSKPSPSWIRVMESCWEKSPGKRMTASDALAVLKVLKNKGDVRLRSDSRPPTPPPKKTVLSGRRPRGCSQKPPVMPKTKPKSTRASVSYSSKSEDLSLHLDSNDKAQTTHFNFFLVYLTSGSTFKRQLKNWKKLRKKETGKVTQIQYRLLIRNLFTFIITIMKENKGRCKESTIKGHRKNLNPRRDSNPRPSVFYVFVGLNPIWGSDFSVSSYDYALFFTSRFIFLYNNNNNISGIGSFLSSNVNL